MSAPNVESTQMYQHLEQLRDVDAIMANFADHAQQIFEGDPTRDILIPLNGSVLPLFYVMQRYESICPEQLPEFIKRLVFVVDTKDKNRKVTGYETSRRILSSNLFYLDDIVDEGHSAATFLNKVSGHIDVIAPLQKEHTEKHRRMYDSTRLGTQTINKAPNAWIAGGLGMNEGVNRGALNPLALLSTLQRFSRSVYSAQIGADAHIQDRIDFFRQQLLPAFPEDDSLLRLCYHMEYAKITGDTQGLLGLSQQIIPIIMDKLGVTT